MRGEIHTAIIDRGRPRFPQGWQRHPLRCKRQIPQEMSQAIEHAMTIRTAHSQRATGDGDCIGLRLVRHGESSRGDCRPNRQLLGCANNQFPSRIETPLAAAIQTNTGPVFPAAGE